MSARLDLSVGDELRLAPQSIEALARQIAELLASGERPRPRHLTAAEVSDWWGVDRAWVYAHATELGAKRLGAGERPRLRFDADVVASRIDELGPSPEVARGPHMAAPDNGRPDSLEPPSRAMVAGRSKRAGGRGTAARPAPGHRASEWCSRP
jgi:hypothetical protein